MKMTIIGAVLLILVLAILYVVTGGLQSTETEAQVVGEPEAVVVDPATPAQEPGNKQFNF